MKYTFQNGIIAEGKWPSSKRGALNESIKKWKLLVEHLEKGGGLEPAGVSSCSLCYLYFDANECIGCPVSKKTGEGVCHATPYYEYTRAYSAGNFAEALRAAKREVKFLESLK
jgi:hypothetical protein